MYSFSYLEPVCCSMSSSNCCFLTCIQISQEADQVVWYSHLFQNFPQFIVIHTVKGFGIVKKAEIDVFLELSCFFDDPVDVGNSISGSSAFSKTSLNIWKFMVHVLLKPGLENLKHYFTSVWDECNCARRLRRCMSVGAVKAHKRDWEVLPWARGQGRWLRGADHIRGKEQRLCFAGAAIKRDPMSKVRETQVREGIRGQTGGNHNHRQLANLITWTTAFSNSMKLSHALMML